MLPNVTGIAYNGVINSHIVVGDRMEENEISVTAAAKKIKVSVATLARAARLGHLQARRLGIGNAWVTTLEAAQAWKKAYYKPSMKRK